MPLTRLDHVNLRTARLGAMCRFYQDVLGMERGFRPDFAFGGAWLYAGGHPLVHLVETQEAPAGGGGGFDHYAFAAADRDAFVARLRAADIPFEQRTVPVTGAAQIFTRDPDGNRIELQFAPSAAEI